MSSEITSNLTDLICQQNNDVSALDNDAVKEKKNELKLEKEKDFQTEHDAVCQLINEKEKRTLTAAQEKGASSWLSALPLQKLGYTLNKQEFRDAIFLRFGWEIKDTPVFCACGSKNSIDHILTCKLGGYVSMRHNALRDTEANLMKEVCRDVKVEPELIAIESDFVDGSDNDTAADRARLDI